MELTINGAARQLPAGSSVQNLLEALDLSSGRLAVELNGEIVPRSEFDRRLLDEGDRVEIVRAIGGG